MRAASEFMIVGWTKLFPLAALDLMSAIGAAAQHGDPASVEDLHVDPNRSLLWFDVDPECTAEEQQDVAVANRLRRTITQEALAARDLACPETVGHLMDTLATLGVLTRAGTTPAERWAIARPLPLPESVLVLPQGLVDEMADIRWYGTVVAPATTALFTLLRDLLGSPSSVTTDIAELARACDLATDSVRAALSAMVDEPGVATMHVITADNSLVPADPERVAEDTPVVLAIDWDAVRRTYIQRGE